MDHITHTLQQAAGHVKIAIRRLAGKYPFHAKTLERFNLRAQADVPTMGVAFVGDDLLLLYSPAFVLGRPLDQLVGVLLHEIHHVIFGHLLMDPADYPDEWARTVAEEVTVNEFVTEPLPKGVIKLKQFPKLPARESTDRRYQRLKRIGKRLPLSSPAALLSGQLGNAGANGNGAGQNKDARGNVLDDHSVWQTAREGGQRAEDAIRAAVQGAAIDVGAAGIPDYLREALQAASIGRVAGDGQFELIGQGQGKLDWRVLLRRYAGSELVAQPDFLRPSRRFPSLVGIIPGRRRRGGRPTVMAVIDTSASITPDLLEMINGELIRLAHEHRVTVVECDAEIQRVYPFKAIRNVQGRGGTDLRPPLAPAFLRKHHPNLVIYFTDGFGDAPKAPPPVPVIWCLTPEGQRPAKWGRVVQMEHRGGVGIRRPSRGAGRSRFARTVGSHSKEVGDAI
ncbi:MAG: VWA-like domain-containing protein [Thermoguttaceae bacterium]